MAPIRILYEDPYLVLCVKPVGVLSEDSPSGACMPGLLREHYRALGQNDYIATVHRLDRLVGGVMLFSRRRDVTGKLTAAVAEHRVTKEYLAVLRGTPAQDEATLTDLLFRDAAHNKSYVVKRMRKAVRQASLSYTVQGKADGLTLVRVQLHTGRTHQIRVQFSSRGLPLLGDIRYGSKGRLLPRPVVHAAGADTPSPASPSTLPVPRRMPGPGICLHEKRPPSGGLFLLCNAQKIKAVRCSYMKLYASKCPISTNRHPSPKKKRQDGCGVQPEPPRPQPGIVKNG